MVAEKKEKVDLIPAGHEKTEASVPTESVGGYLIP